MYYYAAYCPNCGTQNIKQFKKKQNDDGPNVTCVCGQIVKLGFVYYKTNIVSGKEDIKK